MKQLVQTKAENATNPPSVSNVLTKLRLDLGIYSMKIFHVVS